MKYRFLAKCISKKKTYSSRGKLSDSGGALHNPLFYDIFFKNAVQNNWFSAHLQA